MFGTLGVWEILLILLAVVFIFGAKKLPEIGKGMGRAIKNFKRSIKDDPKRIEENESEEDDEDETKE